MAWFQYFSHRIDSETFFCVKCGRFLARLQQERVWDGKEVQPACYPDDNVVAISHLARTPAPPVRDLEEAY